MKTIGRSERFINLTLMILIVNGRFNALSIRPCCDKKPCGHASCRWMMPRSANRYRRESNRRSEGKSCLLGRAGRVPLGRGLLDPAEIFRLEVVNPIADRLRVLGRFVLGQIDTLGLADDFFGDEYRGLYT